MSKWSWILRGRFWRRFRFLWEMRWVRNWRWLAKFWCDRTGFRFIIWVDFWTSFWTPFFDPILDPNFDPNFDLEKKCVRESPPGKGVFLTHFVCWNRWCSGFSNFGIFDPQKNMDRFWLRIWPQIWPQIWPKILGQIWGRYVAQIFRGREILSQEDFEMKVSKFCNWRSDEFEKSDKSS